MGDCFINSRILDSSIVIMISIVVGFTRIGVQYFCTAYWNYGETIELTVKIVIKVKEMDEIDMFNYDCGLYGARPLGCTRHAARGSRIVTMLSGMGGQNLLKHNDI